MIERKDVQLRDYEQQLNQINSKVEKFGSLMEQLISENQKLRLSHSIKKDYAKKEFENTSKFFVK